MTPPSVAMASWH